MWSMQSNGHQVGILTSHKIIHECADRALLEKRAFPKPDFYIGRPLDCKGMDYAVLKSLAIREHKIDIHFDDLDADKLRTLLGNESYKLFSVMPRGRDDEHFE